MPLKYIQLKGSDKPVKDPKAAGNQKRLAENYNDENLAITLLIVGTGRLLTIFGKIKMAGILLTISETDICALAFVKTNYAFIKSGRGYTETERKRNDVAQENLQKAKDKWNEQRRSCLYC